MTQLIKQQIQNTEKKSRKITEIFVTKLLIDNDDSTQRLQISHQEKNP